MIGQALRRGMAVGGQRRLHHRAHGLQVVGLREIERQLRPGAVRQADAAIVLQKVTHDVGDVLFQVVVEIIRLDVAGDGL